MERSQAKEGKIELTAACDGLLKVDNRGLKAVNGFGQMMIATRPVSYTHLGLSSHKSTFMTACLWFHLPGADVLVYSGGGEAVNIFLIYMLKK